MFDIICNLGKRIESRCNCDFITLIYSIFGCIGDLVQIKVFLCYLIVYELFESMIVFEKTSDKIFFITIKTFDLKERCQLRVFVARWFLFHFKRL